MISPAAILSMVAVGALWGCTNPFLRKGAVDSEAFDNSDANHNSHSNHNNHNNHNQQQLRLQHQKKRNGQRSLLRKLLDIRVWMPLLLNQVGSLLFYIQLGQNDLTVAGPFCNGISLVFSVVASTLLGEGNSHPARAMLGSSLVIIGIAICVTSEAQ
eukprot:CAMPEP_0198120782 /NCGR_PEP_ID=MMETSP1442-20131203/30277_1 /TAXON_ID= /ORGANISM="Craspedostauros australis, Strain CCMP3328" /LENGTH=156 /DNA_ID=CAMNT_0043779497 /DNA_START=57 /DNA_END=527 /DNA_ORIENTATION=-